MCTPSVPAPPRKRRRPNQDLQERLARCEELLKEYATSATKPTPSPTPYSSPSPSTTTQPASPEQYLKGSTPRLVQDKGNVRFTDSPVWSHIYDELQSMREILESQDSTEGATPSDAPTPDDNSDLLMGDHSAVNLDELHPDPANVFRLWQVFLDRVNPVTKIIHVPTLQPYVAEAASPTRNIPRNIESLLFAIYTMAVIALTEEECMTLFSHSRERCLQRFSMGVRATLQRLGFLVNYDLVTLQALVLYLGSLQGRYDRHAAWVLNGVVIRLAQKMGLHRDGASMGLSPFETEIRRRVWWAIILLDAKYALLSGLSHALLPRIWDTKEPCNINDADLYPSATEPIEDKEGPTEMVFCLVSYRIALFLVQTPNFATNDLVQIADILRSDDPNHEQRVAMRTMLEKLEKSLREVMDKFCDPSAGPLHLMAWELHNMLVDKMKMFVKLPHQQPEWARNIRSTSDGLFSFAIHNSAHQIQNYRLTENTGFLWYMKCHFQPDVHGFIVGQLVHRTSGPLVDKAWELIRSTYHYHLELFNMNDSSNAATAVILLRAWRKREAFLASTSGVKPETPLYVRRLQQLAPPDRSTTSSGNTPASEPSPDVSEGMRWESMPMFGGYMDFSATLDWEMFANMNEQAVPTGGISSFMPPFGQ